ncbi:MAG TPA: ABC transporter ATP-binding protein [Candidatus Absconditabacterales bacterium]|nr:ABC transporter ATP-binding protein [Candidatus Absconditabacterales bacterium]
MLKKELAFWKKFFGPALQFKWLLMWVIFSSIFFGSLAFFRGYILKMITVSIETKNLDQFFLIIGVLLILIVLRFLLFYPLRNKRQLFENRIQLFLYEKYLSRYIISDNNKVEGFGTGKMNSIIQRGCDTWKRLLSLIIDKGLLEFFSLLFIFFGVFFVFGGFVFLIVLLFFGLSFSISYYGNDKLKGVRRQRREYTTLADSHIVRLIMSKFEVLQNQKILFELKQVVGIFDKILGYSREESKMIFYSWDSQIFVFDLSRVCVYLYVGYGVFLGNYMLSDLMLIVLWMGQINSGLIGINGIIQQYFQEIIQVEKLRDTFDDMPKIKGYDEGKKFVYKNGDIVLKGMNYSYSGSKDAAKIFDNLSLSIAGGKKTALVGLSGSGKTTLIKLFAGYLHADSGEILIDKQKLPTGEEVSAKTVMLESYYNQLGYLTQEPSVFDGTIRENLIYGIKKLPTSKRGLLDLDEKIKKALNQAECQFVWDMKNGVDSQIGEKGVRLSGGQRQRLAIAKIFLKDPKIILLDEPTSALDSFSEEKVSEALHRLFEGRTVVIVAHRLQTVKEADEILVFESKNGYQSEVVERGTHQQLTKKKGIYARMLELQSGF